MKINKKKLALFGLPILCLALVAGAYLAFYGQIHQHVNVEQAVVLTCPDNDCIEDYSGEIIHSGDTLVSKVYTLTNNADTSRDVELVTSYDQEIETGEIITSYWELNTPPTIDGVISDGEWDGYLWFDETLTNYPGTTPVNMPIKIYMTNDADNLYVALDIPDTYDMRDNPEVAEGSSDTFGLNIGVEGEERSYSRVLQFNTATYPENPEKREGWYPFDDYMAQWSVATSEDNVDKWGPSWEAHAIPSGVQSKTLFDETHRVQEIAIPLSDLGISLGDTIRIGGAIRASEYDGYNFHALYPIGLEWGDAVTYKGFTLGLGTEFTSATLQPLESLDFVVVNDFMSTGYEGTITTSVIPA